MFNRFKKQVQDDQGKIKLGTRVIRGPDWNHKCEDNGEGFLGTIVAFDEDKRLIEVIWDSGRKGQYRADPEKYDLRMFDNAPTGELHHGTVCHYCSDRPIHGMKWTCKKCNIDMCTQCYINDKHDQAHGLERKDTLESKRYKIRPGNSFKERVVIKGIFEGAEVVAGPNSKHDFASDGGDVGYVEEVTSWQNKYHRGIVSVFWKASNRTQFHRLGAEGCVDIFCSRLTETASGGTCYVDNLPVIDFNRMSTETPDLVPRTSDGYFEWQLNYQHETVTPSKETLEGTGSYSHFESTVMLVGGQCSGKTCIARYLIGKQQKRLRMSTNGIVIYNDLAYMDLETKEWLVGNEATVNKKAPIIIWDFSGQDVFYPTHQTFLTYRAFYIIVLDGSLTLDDPCLFEQYLPGKSGHKTARDYLLFWISTIVTYCRGSIQGFPKIMIVLTHKDQLRFSDVENRRHELFAEIRHMFIQTPYMQQLMLDDEIFVNAKDKHDSEMVKIRRIIIRESEKQPTWGESLPKCFIPLELEFASMIKRNIHVITREKLNAFQTIRLLSETELHVFLHSISKGLYFDEKKLDKHVILSPTFLIDAFKSIITDKSFVQGDREYEEMWDLMSKCGVVLKRNIQNVWKKKRYQQFYQHKNYLLDVMTYLGKLVEPRRYDSSHSRIPADFYYVPSMVRAKDDSGYLHSAGITHRSIAIAFQSTSFIIPPALSFSFISYCLSVWSVKRYGYTNREMLFHRSGVFEINPSLDMYILSEDDKITVRLVHVRTNTLIMRDLASSIYECLTSTLEKLNHLYIKTSSDRSNTKNASFVTSLCCNSVYDPCILQFENLAQKHEFWICPNHGIEHRMHTIISWIPREEKDICGSLCPVTNKEFLEETPSDLHLRRLSLMYSSNDVRELAIHLGLSATDVDSTMNTGHPMIWKFDIFRQCRESHSLTFRKIKQVIEAAYIGNIHTLCKIVKGDLIEFDREPEKWDLVPTEEHIDILVPLVGIKSLPFLIELGMDFHTWERISHKQDERDLVRLNKDILEEWSNKFCRMQGLRPTLRTIAQSFSNIGKNVKIVENMLSHLF